MCIHKLDPNDEVKFKPWKYGHSLTIGNFSKNHITAKVMTSNVWHTNTAPNFG